MSWRRIALYYGLLGVAVVVYIATAPARDPALPPSDRVRLIELRADRVGEMRLQRGAAEVHCEQEAGRWRLLEPAGAWVPPDLVATFVLTLVEARAVEVVEGESAAADERFGVTGEDATRVKLYEVGHETPVTVVLGSRNPTETAIYARVEGRPEIFVIGRVLQYYVDGIFEAVRGRPSPRATPAIDRPQRRFTG